MRFNAVFRIERSLLGAAPLGLSDGLAHGFGRAVGVQNGLAVQITRRAANGLDQAALRAQKALFVGIQNGHQRHLGDVQPLAQQVDAHQHIEHPQTQVADDLYALHRIHIRVQIAHLDAVFSQVLSELLGHALGQGGDEHALGLLHAQTDFLQHIVHLRAGWAHFNFWIDQARGAHQLLHHLAAVLLFVLGGRGRDKNGLAHALLKLLQLQRPVVQRRRQAKAVLHQRGLARAVAVVHG